MRRALRDVLLVVGVSVTARDRAFGLYRAMDTAGALVGPLLGLAANQLLHQQMRPLMYISIIPAVLRVLLIRAVREPPHHHKAAPADSTRRGRSPDL